MKNKTYLALLDRGIDSKFAERLVQEKYTLKKIKSLKSNELKSLGFDEAIIDNLLKESRPPIPPETIIKLLYESKWTCCVCRDQSRGIIIHHIKEWNESHSHDENNLVVLCPLHHDEAHTTRKLTLVLTPERLINLKQKWIEEVRYDDRKIILDIIAESESRWDYFNHGRIFELFLLNEISNEKFKTTQTMQRLNLINNLGTFSLLDDLTKTHLYHFSEGHLLAYYMTELFSSLINTIPFIDITDKFKKSELKAFLKEGLYVAIQAGFYFKQISKKDKGLGQERIGYYKKNKIRLEFIFDPYECRSVSAYCSHLVGHKRATVIGMVRSIIQEKDSLVIVISCLAIGCYMKPHVYIENNEFNNFDFWDYEED